MSSDFSESELLIYRRLYKEQGARIRFNCDRATYQGIVDTILPTAGIVILNHTKIVEDDTYVGKLRFHFSDIKSFTVVETADKATPYPKNEYLMNILKNACGVVPDESVSREALFGDRYSIDSDEEDSSQIEEKQDDFILDRPSHLSHRLPNDCTIIDTIQGDFPLSIRHIKEEPVIGVSFSGSQMNRFHELKWVCISTRICVFLYDIQNLRMEAFDKGLRNIFESKSIKKVIHDCRFVADCLAGQYSTQLTNVFDTLVADYVISQQRHDDKYEYNYVITLESCLRTYLKVPDEFLFRRECSEKSPFDSHRPISNALMYDLMRNSLYLVPLREELLKEMMTPLSKNVDAYLNVLAKSSQQAIDSLGCELSSPDAIPPGMLMNGIQTVSFQAPIKKAPISLQCRFIDPKTGRILDLPKKTPSEETVTKTHEKVCAEADKDAQTKRLNEKILMACTKKFKQLENQQEMSEISDVKVSPCDKENDSKISNCQTFFLKSSQRQVDDIYHKLVHSVCRESSVITGKPNYVSKVTVRKPFSDYSNSLSKKANSSDSGSASCENSEEQRSSTISKIDSDCSDLWAKIRAEHESSPQYYNNRKVVFVPA